MSQALRASLVVAATALAAALLTGAGGPGVAQGGGAARACAGDPYAAVVRSRFIDRRLLILRDDVRADSGLPIVDLDPSVYRGEHPDELDYAQHSFLMADIRANNPALWTVENGRVTDINPCAHRAAATFETARPWRGSLLFRERPPGSGQNDLRLSPVGWRGPVLRLTSNPGRLTTGDARVRILDVSGPVHDLAGPAVDLLCPGAAAGERRAASLFRVGDQAVVQTYATACRIEVRGRELPAGEADGLALYDEVALVAPDERRFSFQRLPNGSREEGLSDMTPLGERRRQGATQSWAEAFERDYQRAAAGLSEPGGDVRTSLDPVLHAAVQNRLDDFTAHLPAGDRPRRAAITVMDAVTGEVLVMATQPGGAAFASGFMDRDDDVAREARTNQNLQLLPIGSAAKPIFSAAILAVRPDLIGLRMPAMNGRIDNLMGLPLSSGFNTHSARPIVDFDGFIRDSDNGYAATLLLLGSADRDERQHVPLAPGQRYFLGDTELTWRVKSIFESPDGHGGYVTVAPRSRRQLVWLDSLERLFDVNGRARGTLREGGRPTRCSQGGGAFGDDLSDEGPWRALFEARGQLDPCGFKEAGLVREAFAADAATNFRTELIPVMLGNGEGRWSAVKLAEAYARLASGRRVAARFMRTEEAEDFGSIIPNFAARGALTHAMTLVPQGTAANTRLPGALSELQAALPPGLVLGFFGKTGTPSSPFADYTPADRALNLLIRRGRIVWDARAHRAAVLVNTARAAPTDRASRQRAARMLAGDPVAANALRESRYSAVAAAAALARYNAAIAAGETPFVIRRDGVLVRVARRTVVSGADDDPDHSEGKVMALVVAVYRTGSPRLTLGADGRASDGLAQPLAAYSIVVNLQFSAPQGHNTAADLSADIIRMLAPRLTAAGVR